MAMAMHVSSAVLMRNNVRVVGAGAKTVVLAHGFGSDQSAWRHIEAALAPNHQVVLFDLVGSGHAEVSAYSPRRYRSLHAYAADLLEILAELSLESVIYIGHSMSGMIGLLAGITEPERFERMVFVGASPRYLNDTGYVGGFDQSDINALYSAMSSNYQAWASGFSGLVMGYPERPELAAEFASTLTSIRPDIAVAVARLIFQSDHRADLAKLSVPTLIIQTQHDPAVPAAVGTFLSTQIPRAELRIVDAQGHFPHLSAPDAVLSAVLPFIAQAGSQ